MVKMPEIPKSKPLGIIFLGIILFAVSVYLNILQTGSANIGMYLAVGLIIIGISAQVINWRRYWKKN